MGTSLVWWLELVPFIESPALILLEGDLGTKPGGGPSCVKTSLGRSKGLLFTTSGRVSSLESVKAVD